MPQLEVTDSEAKLLLKMAERYADGLELNPDPQAQDEAQQSSVLAGRIAGLLKPPAPAPDPIPAAATAALVWQRPTLGLVTSQGSWVPEVELVNQSDHSVELSGSPMATGRLLRPDGTPVATKAKWAMPAVAIIHRLAPGQSVPIRVAVQLLEDEIAALEPGFYRLTEVTWGALTAPDKDVRVDAV